MAEKACRHCVACGYNLVGTDPDTACPECGLPVAVSVAGDVLRLPQARKPLLYAAWAGILYWLLSAFVLDRQYFSQWAFEARQVGRVALLAIGGLAIVALFASLLCGHAVPPLPGHRRRLQVVVWVGVVMGCVHVLASLVPAVMPPGAVMRTPQAQFALITTLYFVAFSASTIAAVQAAVRIGVYMRLQVARCLLWMVVVGGVASVAMQAVSDGLYLLGEQVHWYTVEQGLWWIYMATGALAIVLMSLVIKKMYEVEQVA